MGEKKEAKCWLLPPLRRTPPIKSVRVSVIGFLLLRARPSRPASLASSDGHVCSPTHPGE